MVVNMKNYTIEDIKNAFFDGFYQSADDLFYKEWDFDKDEVKSDTEGARRWQEYSEGLK